MARMFSSTVLNPLLPLTSFRVKL